MSTPIYLALSSVWGWTFPNFLHANKCLHKLFMYSIQKYIHLVNSIIGFVTPVWETHILNCEPGLGPQIIFNASPKKGIGQFKGTWQIKEPKKIAFTFKLGSKVIFWGNSGLPLRAALCMRSPPTAPTVGWGNQALAGFYHLTLKQNQLWSPQMARILFYHF